jgi:uncharacterized phage protein (TIGR01671 family)
MWFELGDITGLQAGHIIIRHEFVIDKESIEQFTGLLDKNGKEIYEGDVLQVAANNCYEITFANKDEDQEIIAAFCLRKGEREFGIDTFSIREGKIIGNIYENPELLK